MLKPLNEERNFKFYFGIIYYDINLATQQQNSKIDFCFVNFFYLIRSFITILNPKEFFSKLIVVNYNKQNFMKFGYFF